MLFLPFYVWDTFFKIVLLILTKPRFCLCNCFSVSAKIEVEQKSPIPKNENDRGIDQMKTGIIDVGGGLRGIYAAGILDTCMKQNVKFDCCIGVSAGSANMASFLAGQAGRNYRFFHDYSFRKKYMSFRNLLHNGSYIDLEYIYGTLSNSGGEDPLNWEKIKANPADLITVSTDARTGRPKYFTKDDMGQDNYRIFMASCCLPGINKPIAIGKDLYFDGALSDPVPLKKAFDEGCDKVVVILTKPVDLRRVPGKDLYMAKLIRRKYPKAARGLCLRAERYNKMVDRAEEYVKKGKVLLIGPEDISGVDTLKRNAEALHRLYGDGLKDGEKLVKWMKQ